MDLSRNTCRVLNVSTGHISKATAEALGDPPDCQHTGVLWNDLSYVGWHEYGWIIWCAGFDEEPLEDYPDLLALLQFAERNGFEMVKLDCDAPALPAEAGLPTFEW